MKTGQICEFIDQRLLDRRSEKVSSAWVENKQSRITIPRGLSQISRGKIGLKGLVNSDAPLLLMIAAKQSLIVSDIISQDINNRKVYVLVSSTWGERPEPSKLLALGNVLIRQLPSVPASGAYCDKSAVLRFGARAASVDSWSMELDLVQAEAFRQHFLRMFWHDSEQEAWNSGGKLQFVPVRERPFDVPFPQESLPISLVDALPLFDTTKDGVIYLSSQVTHVPNCRKLWCAPSGDAHEKLSRMVRDGAELVWEDLELPDLEITGSSGRLVLPHAPRMGVQLNRSQVEDFSNLLSASPMWRFVVEREVSELHDTASQVWLAGAPVPRKMIPLQELDAGSVSPESLRMVEGAGPRSWPDPDPLACKVLYRWKVLPIRAPRTASEDPLVGKWRDLDRDWASRLEKLRKAITDSESKTGALGKTYKFLMGSWLGFGKAHKELIEQVEYLQAIQPSALGPDGTMSEIDKLLELEKRVSKLSEDVEKEEQKAWEEQELEKYTAAWKKRVQNANEAANEVESELALQRESLDRTVSDLESAKEDAKSAEDENKADVEARMKHLGDEKRRLEEGIRRNSQKAESLRNDAAETFEFRLPPQKGKASLRDRGFIPKQAPLSSFTVPHEALPKVGLLRSQNKHRYLVIKNWEDMDLGETEAVRLGATLVAQEDR